MKTCWDCLFYGKTREGGEYICIRTESWVDGDQNACPYFLPDSHNCCLDCSRLESRSTLGSVLFGDYKCTASNRTIPHPSNYVCSNFRY